MTLITINQKVPQVIVPLIQQHVSNAAFLYQQIKESLFSHSCDADLLTELYASLSANIDGIIEAKQTGLALAKSAFFRWLSDNEVYLYARLLYQTKGYEKEKSALLEQVIQDKTLQPGFVQGVACHTLPEEFSDGLFGVDNQQRALSIWIHAARKVVLPVDSIDYLFDETDPDILSAVCHYCLILNKTDFIPHLATLAKNSIELSVRYHTVYTLAWLAKEQASIFYLLYDLLQAELVELQVQKGLLKRESEKRIEILVRLCGLFASKHQIDIAPELSALPMYLQILMISYASNWAYLPMLIDCLEDKLLARLAFRAVCLLTDLEIDDSRLTLFPQSDDEEDELPVDSILLELSAGIGFPDKNRIEALIANLSLQQTQMLKGKKINKALLIEQFNHGSQEIRYLAAWHLTDLSSTIHYIDITQQDTVVFEGEINEDLTRF